jgi:DNA-binding SARP family transcriptional activator
MVAELTVRVVGRFTVSLGDTILPATRLGSRKARTLLALLTVNASNLPINRIITALWPGPAPRDPPRNVATLISRLRAVLGPDTIAGDRNAYRIGNNVHIDLTEAAGLVSLAEAELAAGGRLAFASTAASRATGLLDQGGVLDDQPDAPWAEPARAKHGELLRRAWHATGEAALRLGDIPAARTAAQAAINADALDETAYRMLMHAHFAAGEPAWALLAYQRLRDILDRELGIYPAAPTRELYQSILQDTPAGPRVATRGAANR